MAGNRLGEKIPVTYTSDTGELYNMRIDADLVIVGAGLIAGHSGSPAPKRFKPRVVYAQQPIAPGKMARKKLICGTSDSGFYSNNTPVSIQIDGEFFTTTGRRGESLSFS